MADERRALAHGRARRRRGRGRRSCGPWGLVPGRPEAARGTPEARGAARAAGRAAAARGRRGEPAAAASAQGETSYARYRSRPRSLIARLRAESDSEIFQREVADYHDASDAGGKRRRVRTGPWWRRWTVRRVILAVVGVAVGWVLLSAVLFVISAQVNAGNLPAGYQSQLTSAGPMLTSANTVLILGLDNRPRTGTGSKEGGLQSYNYSEADANTDTIMLWRVGGGVSRRLSIPRDTLVTSRATARSEINAAWSQGGPGARAAGHQAVHGPQDQPSDRRRPRQLPEIHR